MKKIIFSGGIALLTIPSLCYYIIKYYIHGSLNFEQSMIVIFTLLSSLMIIGILLGVYNAYQNLKLHNQNLALHNEIVELNRKIEEYHYDNIEYHENNRDILLDLEVK